MNLVDTALALHAAGLCVLPARLDMKRPPMPWGAFQRNRPGEQQIRAWFADAEALCIICGIVSGHLELIDFDNRAELFPKWKALVESQAPGLLDRIYLERTQNDGKHALYRTIEPSEKCQALALRNYPSPDANEIEVNGKRLKPRKRGDQYVATLILIETKCQGGLVVCAPSPGYVAEQGDLTKLPVLTAQERNILIEAARALNESFSDPIQGPALERGTTNFGDRPGDEFNMRGDVGALLAKHGWTRVKGGENEYWRRPGKTEGWSATLKGGVLYCFTTNAPPFEQYTAYPPFATYALLEHDGNFAQAASALRAEGYGGTLGTSGVDLSKLLPNSDCTKSDLQVITPEDLFNFDAQNDPNTLLGNRWLCRGGSCLVIGQTGIGKSSFSMQAAITWALGEPLFGITPVRPLKSLVIQAENDLGDLSEMFCGVLYGTDRTCRLSDLQSMLRFVSETSKAGDAFHPFVYGLIEQHKPDLVWVDPLFSFLGGNASEQETVSKFLRNGLGAIAQKTGVTWMVVHHTNKPPKDPDRQMAYSDFAYLGSGSAELANWARAVLSVREIAPGRFELRASKRGRRAGLQDADGVPATEAFLKHGDHGICWERALPQEDEREEIENDLAAEVIAAMEPGKVYDRTTLRKLAETTLKCSRSNFTQPGKRGYRVLHIVLERTRCPQQPGFYSDTFAENARCHLTSSVQLNSIGSNG